MLQYKRERDYDDDRGGIDSKRAPLQETVQDDWIPTDLFREVLKRYSSSESIATKKDQQFLTHTACPTHIRNLQPLASAASTEFATDPMMPRFVGQAHDYNLGRYYVGQVELLDAKKKWWKIGLVINNGDGDCNTGHWGGAYVLEEDEDGDDTTGVTLTPLVWIRSYDDSLTEVQQAKGSLSSQLSQMMADFNALQDLQFDSAVLMMEGYKEDEVFPYGMFADNLRPGTCRTPLEKLVGTVMTQMMFHCDDAEAFRQIKIDNKNSDDEDSEEEEQEGQEDNDEDEE